MKIKIVFLFACIQSLSVFAQSKTNDLTYLKGLSKDFAKTKNNQQFVNDHSDFLYQIDTIQQYMPGEYLSIADSLCFVAKTGAVVGPFEEEEFYDLRKVLGSSDGYFMRVSHILISYQIGNKTKEEIIAKGNLIMEKLKAGESFATLATQYGDDGTRSRGGDIGWFGQKVMVEEFEKAILEHKKGDYFLVWTEFGLHAVHVTEDFKKGKQQVYFTRIIKSKKD